MPLRSMISTIFPTLSAVAALIALLTFIKSLIQNVKRLEIELFCYRRTSDHTSGSEQRLEIIVFNPSNLEIRIESIQLNFKLKQTTILSQENADGFDIVKHLQKIEIKQNAPIYFNYLDLISLAVIDSDGKSYQAPKAEVLKIKYDIKYGLTVQGPRASSSV